MPTDRPSHATLSPLLVMGSPRSGTTFLAHMINRFFDIRLSRDNGTLVRFYDLLPHYEPLSDDANLRRLISNLYADHYIQERLRGRGLVLTEAQLFERVRERTYGGLVEAIFGAIAQERGKSTWGYKRASLARMTGDSVNVLFPKARFVHIIRDAREVALSMAKASTVALLERSWHFGAADWVEHVTRGRAVAPKVGPDRYFEISYESLMADPATVLIEVLDFAGGGPDRDARAERIRAEVPGLIKPDNTAKWRKELPEKGIRQVERVAGPLLKELGYELMYPDVSGRPIGMAEMAYLQAQRAVANIVGAPFANLWQYRMSILKAKQRARFK